MPDGVVEGAEDATGDSVQNSRALLGITGFSWGGRGHRDKPVWLEPDAARALWHLHSPELRSGLEIRTHQELALPPEGEHASTREQPDAEIGARHASAEEQAGRNVFRSQRIPPASLQRVLLDAGGGVVAGSSGPV